ncbi:MAG: hypothetical protein O8C62_02685 [Candidatus Methanoperedens sp.]|nr:hypothetical protein [Candidatus Methanoperedens sp.]
MTLISHSCEGRIYIAGAYKSLQPQGCSSKNEVDNDPHFLGGKMTWGICRFDFRNNMHEGDYVFFVLPKHNYDGFGQMIFAYMKIKEIISHKEAFFRTNLHKKRMRENARVNGNILVDENGGYNKLDDGMHYRNFEKIKGHYAIGDEIESRKLDVSEIREKGKTFVHKLERVFGESGDSVFDILGRKGRKMNSKQVQQLLAWLNDKP